MRKCAGSNRSGEHTFCTLLSDKTEGGLSVFQNHAEEYIPQPGTEQEEDAVPNKGSVASSHTEWRSPNRWDHFFTLLAYFFM